MKVVSNSGPLINLAKVDQFPLLRDLFQHITIPPAVFEEVVVRGGSQPGAGETNTASLSALPQLATRIQAALPHAPPGCRAHPAGRLRWAQKEPQGMRCRGASAKCHLFCLSAHASAHFFRP